MECAIRRISVERGHDPRLYTLVSFGGAGGMHACELADALGMRRVIVPDQPGLLSAWGAVAASVRRDFVQTIRLVDPRPADLRRRLDPLERRARRALLREGAGATPVRVTSLAECRYPGQSYEIRVPVSTAYRAAFHAAHRRLYGYADETRPVEVVNVRVSATADGPGLPRFDSPRRPAAAMRHRVRWNGRWTVARRLERDTLSPAHRLRGPLVITELSATTFVPPGWTARATKDGDLLLQRSGTSGNVKIRHAKS
jgi:N-methylhydantoinase A